MTYRYRLPCPVRKLYIIIFKIFGQKNTIPSICPDPEVFLFPEFQQKEAFWISIEFSEEFWRFVPTHSSFNSSAFKKSWIRLIETTNLTVSITAHGRSVRGIRIKLNRDTETNIWNMKTVEHIFGQIQKLIFSILL